MPNFRVEVTGVVSGIYVVESEDLETAENNAIELFQKEWPDAVDIETWSEEDSE